jgi:predicted ATPase/transcriptional regulator with XRE-family HTH domain
MIKPTVESSLMHSGPTEFGALLRRLRLDAGLSQEALAERARISAKAVGSLELGTRRAPYRETVELLLNGLNAGPLERSQLTAVAEKSRVRSRRSDATTATPVTRTNVVLPTTRLIGRDHEVAKTTALLTQHRLVTLIGPGGVGKTRVALSLASETSSRFRDGSWLIDLSSLPRLASVAQTAATTLRVPEKKDVPILDGVVEFLAEREMLVVLDNCEHVLPSVAEFVQAALHRAKELRILATSRETLRIPGESVYEIRPLQWPPLDESLGSEAALRYAAVELFHERATTHDAEFTMQNGAVRAITRIVRRLDGLPLAIELAAARVRVLGLKAIEELLDRRFEILSGGGRVAPSRQQTLRATIQWSYDGLSESEQLLFRRLGIFVGGWSLEAAERICGDETSDATLNDLASLVDKSLVSTYQERGTLRYRFLDSTRAFALDALTSCERRTVALKHAQWVLEVLKTGEDRITTASADTRWAPLLSELDNIRAALTWCDEENNIELGSTIASFIADFAYWRGVPEEGCRWLQRFLDQLGKGGKPEVTVRLLCGLARLTSDTSARLEASSRAVAVAEQNGLAELLAVSYMRYAVALYLRGSMKEAIEANSRALEEFHREKLQWNPRVAWSLQHRSWMLVALGRLEEARTCTEDAIRIFRQLKADRETLALSNNLAELEFAAGEPERALQIVDEAIPVAAKAGDPEAESIFVCNRAGYLLRLGDFTEAEATAREAVALAVAAHRSERTLHALEHLAAALAARNETGTAAQLAGFVQAAYTRSGYQRETTERSSHDMLVTTLGRALSEDELTALMNDGADMTNTDAVAVALG